MKVVIGYPPLPGTEELGVPLVSQNRQFQYFNEPTFIYPCIPAYAATMLDQDGHEVLWLDGPAEGLSWGQYLRRLIEVWPDYIIWEVKTPTVNRVMALAKELKRSLPKTSLVIVGDHITARPLEVWNQCREIDIPIAGGDFDFAIRNIVKKNITRTYYEEKNENSLKDLPVMNRKLTKWWLYAYKNGNFKYLPGTYTYFGRDCWWRKDGGCTFCSWTTTFKNFRVVTPDQAMAEIENCHSLGIREIFDDTGTFPIGHWLEEFCEKLIRWKERSRSRFPIIGCNMRPGAIDKKAYSLLGRAGFRFILYGLESANQHTLDRINKGQSPGDMEHSLRMAKQSGLEPHVTCMIGYPWETLEDARRTIQFTKNLFQRGLIDTLQATIVIPYPGTQLFREAEKNGWLLTRNWDDYDMRRPVMACGGHEEEIRALTQGLYKSFITPGFIARKVLSIRSADDIKFFWRAAKYVLGHLKDFSSVQPVHRR